VTEDALAGLVRLIRVRAKACMACRRSDAGGRGSFKISLNLALPTKRKIKSIL